MGTVDIVDPQIEKETAYTEAQDEDEEQAAGAYNNLDGEYKTPDQSLLGYDEDKDAENPEKVAEDESLEENPEEIAEELELEKEEEMLSEDLSQEEGNEYYQNAESPC